MNCLFRPILIVMLFGSLISTPTRGQESPAHPVTLEEAIAIALRNAPRLQATESLTEAARHRVTVAQAGLAARWEGIGGYEISRRHEVPQGFAARVRVQRTFSDGGQTRAQVEQAKANVTASESQHARAQQDIVLAVKQAFDDVLYYQQVADLKEQTVLRAQGYVELSQGLFSSGQVAERDITQAQAVLAAAQFEAADAESKVNAAKAALRSAMGLPWDAPLEVAGALTPAERLPDLKTFIEHALPNHPDVQRAQAEVLAAEAQVRIAESQRKPTVALNGSTGVQERTFPPTRGVLLFSATVQLPLADGGQTRAQIAEAQARLASAKAFLSHIKLELEREVSQSWYLAQSAQQKIDAAQKAIPFAQESLRLAEAQYRAGVGTLLSVTDAQVVLLTAMTNRMNAIYEYRLTEAQLQHAAGLLEETAKRLRTPQASAPKPQPTNVTDK